jgi:glycerol kinase
MEAKKMEKKYIMGIDQGTTGSRVLFFDKNAELVSLGYKEIKQLFPKPGWVEHDAMEDFDSVYECMQMAMEKGNIKFEEIAGIGMTNQRETAVMWYKDTGKPVYNSIIWQSRQSTPICDKWIADGYGPVVQQKTGLSIDAYFSASKVVWIIENVPGVREEIEKGNVCFGNIDAWLYWNFSKGNVYAEDASNAARSMMYNINTLEWDKELIHNIYGIPEKLNFPKVVENIGILGYTHPDMTGGIEIPFGGGLGDQQAGTFGQTAFDPLTGKVTYGTAGVIDINIGHEVVLNNDGIPTTLGWLVNGQPTYLQEAVSFNCGGIIQWLRDGLKILPSAPESGPIAESVPDTKDVYVVPANNGLFSPWIDPYARTTIVGITGGVTEAHVIRATLEGIAFSMTDCIRATEKALGKKLASLNVDGGACQADFMMQFQADMFGFPLHRPKQIEMTALGATYAGGIGVGFWPDMDYVRKFWQLDRTFEPKMSEDEREERYAQWLRAIRRARDWADKSKP